MSASDASVADHTGTRVGVDTVGTCRTILARCTGAVVDYCIITMRQLLQLIVRCIQQLHALLNMLTAVTSCASVPSNTSARVHVDSVVTRAAIDTRSACTVVDH